MPSGEHQGGKSGPPQRHLAIQSRDEIDTRGFLLGTGLSGELLIQLEARARDNGTTVEAEILAGRHQTETQFYRAIAAHLNIGFLENIEAERIIQSSKLDTQLIRPMLLRLGYPNQAPLTVIVPELSRLASYRRMLTDSPGLAASMRISTPSEIRQAVWTAGEKPRLAATLAELFERQPEASARITFMGGQGFVAGVGVALIIGLMLSRPTVTFLALHLFLSAFYLASLMLRSTAVYFRQNAGPPEPLARQAHLPVYTVLVALYREKEVAEQLVRRLSMLDWPRSRLDIKIICEADDAETIEAVLASNPGPEFEIVRVPQGGPRTKPKALSYALNAARGDFLAVYDAEDRPHPGQLREAYQAFSRLPAKVACLQAPLVIANSRENWLTALFALEYAGLFRCLLPLLSHKGLPLPLGGTSNHFRTAVLDECGGWDPYNVTEDADLGMRLYRRGYRTATLHRATLEDAPVDISAWLGQRTRWFKGWLQTWLVVMRHPIGSARQMGPAGTLCFHLLITGMLVSSLSHPVLMLFILAAMRNLLFTGGLHPIDIVLMVIDGLNIIGSYVVFMMLGRAGMTERERRCVGWKVLMVPLYWALITAAAWTALYELRKNPFFWNKTAHKPSNAPEN